VAAQIFNLGKLRFFYKGAWSNSTTYQTNDIVTFGANLYVYVNTAPASGNAVTDTVYWAVILEGFKYRGAYSNLTTYLLGESVTSGGILYRSTATSQSNVPPPGGTWTALSEGFQFEGSYSAGTTYQKNDVVTYDGQVWIALQGTTGNAPAAGLFWQLLVPGTFPNLGGNAGKILTTDGSAVSWTNNLDNLLINTEITTPAGGTYVGSLAENFSTTATLTDPALVVAIDGGASSFAQVAFTNKESTSSTDLILYMDNGNDSVGWVGMGIAGSNFDDTTYGITGPGDGYIFHDTKDNNYDGNLVFATGDSGAQNKIIFAAGGFASGNTQMEITPDVNVHIEIPTPSTSPTTGALTIVGGVGIQGDVNIAGNITFGGTNTSVSTSNLSVSDPFIFVGNANAADTLDLGLVGEYAVSVSAIVRSVNNKALTSNVATLTTSAAHTYLVGDWVVVTGVDATFNGTYQITAVTTDTFSYAKTAGNVSSTAVSPVGSASVSARRKFAGIVRDATDGIYKLFTGATTKPATTVNFAEAGLALGALTVGDFVVGTNQFTANATTGNTNVAGTFTVATNKFSVTSAGAVTLAGDVDGGDKGYTKFHSKVNALGTTGGNISVNVGTAPVTTFTPNANSTITFTGFPAAGYAAYWEVEVIAPQSFTVTFSGVTWNGGSAIAAQTGTKKTVFAFRTRDGGSTIYGATTFGDIA
jgi:hypothetical protein